MREPTAEECKALWLHMSTKFGSTIVSKEHSALMHGVGAALDAFGVQDKDAFMKNFATTIGRTIYTPFEIGKPSGNWEVWNQMVICAHEHQHVVQMDREGPVGFAAKYLVSKAERAQYEAEAYRCNMELHYWRTKTLRSPEEMASRLSQYGCSKIDIEVAAKTLTLYGGMLVQGAVISEAAREAITWLDANVADIRNV